MFSRFRLFGRKTTPTVPVPAVSEPAHDGGTLHDRILSAYRTAGLGGLTADECAHRVGWGILSVRPRITELFQANTLRRTGTKRANYSGLKANVFVLSGIGCEG